MIVERVTKRSLTANRSTMKSVDTAFAAGGGVDQCLERP